MKFQTAGRFAAVAALLLATSLDAQSKSHPSECLHSAIQVREEHGIGAWASWYISHSEGKETKCWFKDPVKSIRKADNDDLRRRSKHRRIREDAPPPAPPVTQAKAEIEVLPVEAPPRVRRSVREVRESTAVAVQTLSVSAKAFQESPHWAIRGFDRMWWDRAFVPITDNTSWADDAFVTFDHGSDAMVIARPFYPYSRPLTLASL